MDQERPIEKLLRGAAKDRSEQAGGAWELHPATRRLLHGEVVRCYPRKTAEAGSRWSWNRLCPRLAWAGGLSAVLAVALWAAWPESSEGPRLALERQPAREKVFQRATPLGAVKEQEQPRAYFDPQARQESTTDNLGIAASRLEQGASKGVMEARPASPAPSVEYKRRVASSGNREDKAVAEPKMKAGQITGRAFGVVDGVPSAAVNEPAATATTSAAPFAGVIPAERSLSDVTVALDRGSVPAGVAQRVDGDAVRGVLSAREPYLGKVFYGYFRSVPVGGSAGLAGQNAAGAAGVRLTAGRARLASAPVAAAVEGSKVAVGDSPAKDAVAARGSATVPEKRILRNFIVNQEGNKVLVVDDDGSVYKGLIQSQETSPTTLATSQAGWFGVSGGGNVARPGAEEQLYSPSRPAVVGGLGKVGSEVQAPAASVSSESSSQVFLNFSVTGTNKTLNRKVDFAGKLLVASSNLFSNAASNVVANNLKQVAQPAFLYQNQVMGRATVEGLPAIEVNASQVPSNEEGKTGALPKLPDGP